MSAIRHMAVIITAIITISVTEVYGGGTIIPTVPNTLSVGDNQTMLEGIATNNTTWFTMNFAYTNKLGEKTVRNVSLLFGVRFKSCEDLKDCMVTYAMGNLVPRVLADTNCDSRADITIVTMLNHCKVNADGSFDSSTLYRGLEIYTNVGPAANITTNLIRNLPIRFQRLVYPVPDLKAFRFSMVTPTNICTNSWVAGIGWQNALDINFADNRTTNGVVMIDQWMAMGDYKAKFIIETSTSTNVYTGFGQQVVKPSLSILNRGKLLRVFTTTGMDTTVVWTTDFVHWQEEVTYHWSTETNILDLAINPNRPKKFFSVYCE